VYPDGEVLLSILPPAISNGSLCRNCRSSLGFAAAFEPKGMPTGVVISDQGESWTATAYPPRVAAIGTWVFAFGWTAAVVFIWAGEASGKGAGIFIDLWITAFLPLIVLKAMIQVWGKYVIAGSAETVRLFTGIGSMGLNRVFGLEALSEIRLRTRYGRRGSQTKALVINAGKEFCFGEELSDHQRHFLALLLISKRRLLRQQ
jgi:hypothetical protein